MRGRINRLESPSQDSRWRLLEYWSGTLATKPLAVSWLKIKKIYINNIAWRPNSNPKYFKHQKMQLWVPPIKCNSLLRHSMSCCSPSLYMTAYSVTHFSVQAVTMSSLNRRLTSVDLIWQSALLLLTDNHLLLSTDMLIWLLGYTLRNTSLLQQQEEVDLWLGNLVKLIYTHLQQVCMYNHRIQISEKACQKTFTIQITRFTRALQHDALNLFSLCEENRRQSG